MPPAPQPPSRDQLRELIGLALLVVGFVILAVIAFTVDLRLGFAVLGSTSVVAGYRLTVREV